MKEIWNKYKGYVIIGAILISLFGIKSCVANQYLILRGENKSLEGQVRKLKDGVEVAEKWRIKEKDSINKIIVQKETENKELSSKIATLENKVEQIKNRKPSIPQNSMELVKYFNERNKTKENTVIEDKVGLGITSAKNVVTNLEEGDACKEILPLKDSIITNLKDKVVNLEGVSQNKSIMLISAEKSINSLRELSTLQKNLTDGLGRENKKLRVKSTLNKILLPIAIVGGFYLGTQIKR